MQSDYKSLYCPALRMKAGELAGVRALADDVASCTLPRFIVPPLAERDDTYVPLFELDNVPNIGSALSRHWGGREAFIDATYLIDECGRLDIANWLPRLIEQVRRASVKAIPMALLRELGPVEAIAFKSSIASDRDLRFGICISSGEMVGPEFISTVRLALDRLGVSPQHCAIIADFHDADFSVPEYVAPVISGALELLQEVGQWQRIIFQGTHYPEKNPAKEEGSHVLWPRNEWKAWRQAVGFSSDTAEHMMFGDYAADCAKIAFGTSGGAAIRHYRYSTEDAWFVARGSKSGTDRQIMQAVCSRIVDSGYFAGARFSSADAYILATARSKGGPGNSTTWRQINTTHHITRVVSDISKVRGIRIAEKEQEPDEVQSALF